MNGNRNEYDKKYYLEHKEYKKSLRKKYYLENEELVKSNKKKYYLENIEHIKQIRINFDIKNKELQKIQKKKWRDDNRGRINLLRNKRNIRMKLMIFNHYSNYDIKCNCCGENMIEFLSIDHINNDGASHRKIVPHSNLYSWIINNDYPSGFQILCMNCNFAKGQSKDHICAHKCENPLK